MAIKDTKGRISISLDTELLDAIKESAKKNQRSVSSEIAYTLLNGIKIETKK